MKYERDVSIDPEALDTEWLKQAELMRKYASHAALAKKEMDEAKERLEVGKARIEMSIRKAPEEFGLSKATEGAIQSTILLQPEYQELFREYTEAKYENDIAIAAVRAIDQKKTALENLVKLLAASYFAGPKTPRDLTGEWLKEREAEAERKKQNARIKIKRDKRNRERESE